MIILLKPRGQSAPGTCWKFRRNVWLQLVHEDDNNWFARPLEWSSTMKPLQYPKFAWEVHYQTTDQLKNNN